MMMLDRIWKFRGLSWNLVKSDLKSRFRRSRIGIFWAVLQPLGFSLAIAFVWGAIFQQDFLVFATYVFSGMIVWELFVNTVLGSQDSLPASEGYIKQANIPLIIFQMRTVFSGVFIFFAGLFGLLILLFVLGLGIEIGVHLLLLPVYIVLLVSFLMPVAIIFSFLGTQFRDLKHASGLGTSVLFFLSPVMLSREFLDSERLSLLPIFNPLIPLLDMFRAPLLYGGVWEIRDILVVTGWIAVLWISSIAAARIFGRRIVFEL